MFQITDLRCEFVSNPLGIDSRTPRLSWVLEHPQRGQFQTAYQIQVASTSEQLKSGAADLWDSGKRQSTKLPFVEYAGASLTSRQRVHWRVCAWDTQDRPSQFSAPAWFEMGLLGPEDWQAEWLGFPGGTSSRARYFRNSFTLAKPVQRARAYVCGLGYYELRLNGQKVGQRVLEPAQTDYSRRILYSTYDIGAFVQPGTNVIGAIVGSGWYGTPKLLAQIEFLFEDGTTAQIVTGRVGKGGDWWRVADGPIIENSIYDGEIYDARLERPGWDRPAQDEKDYQDFGLWTGAMAVEAPEGRLSAQTLEPIEVVETLHPKTIQQPKPGIYVFDTGQNLAGWARLRVEGPRGTSVTLRYAEALYEDGTVNQENLRSARARDTYILKGDGVETWEPRFTYHGFRYIQIEGFPGEPTLDSIQIRVVRSAVQPTGTFECDHPLINRIYRAVWWTEASNLHGIPTDCPQRDERMGWLNDMAARSEEAIYNFNLARLLPKWLHDISDTQDSSGAISDTAPYRWGSRPADPVSVCYLLIPWLLYRHYGDLRVLSDHYEGMKGWVNYLTSRATDHIVEYSYYGDWSPPIAEGLEGSIGSSAVARNTPGSLVSTAHYYYAAVLFGRIATVLGRGADAATYRELADTIREAFNRRFWDEARGGYGTNNQACNTVALYMGLVPEERKARVIENLIQDVKAHDFHLTTGNLCTKYILDVLTEAGHGDTAFRLVSQTTYPSWGYMLENGATTIWERWERATGSGMNSHNHPMYASVGAWFYRVLAGIQADSDGPGFGRFAIHPYLPPGMKSAQASLRTIRGTIESAWQVTDNGLSLHVRIPVNSQALVSIPKPVSAKTISLCEGETIVWKDGHQRATVEGIADIQESAKSFECTIGSGDYYFVVQT